MNNDPTLVLMIIIALVPIAYNISKGWKLQRQIDQLTDRVEELEGTPEVSVKDEPKCPSITDEPVDTDDEDDDDLLVEQE